MRKRGRTPDALTSVYCRDRRDAQFDPPGCNHAFIGDGMIHGFYLEPNAAGGSAIHRNHWVRTLRWEAEHEAGRSVFGERGMPSDPSVAAIDRGRANTNIASHAGRLMALQEQSERFELNSRSFDGSGRFMTTGGKFAPHPKMDLELGGMVWFGYSAGARRRSTTLSTMGRQVSTATGLRRRPSSPASWRRPV